MGVRGVREISGAGAAVAAAPSGAVAGVSGGKTGRNAPCPCGSGKKYKRCHGAAA